MTQPTIVAMPAAGAPTMSSREIADLVEKRHDNVKVAIERLSERGIVAFTASQEKSSGGRPGTVYHVNKRDSFVVVAQLCPEFTARLVDRWQALEQEKADGGFHLPRNFAEALQLAADQARQIESMQGAVAALDRIAAADGSLCITDAAKSLQVGPRALFQWLRSNGWIYRRPGTAHDLGYQSKLVAGLLEHKVTTVLRNDGTEKVTEQVRVTAKGIAQLAKLVPSAAQVVK